jgi:hypothetical protein
MEITILELKNNLTKYKLTKRIPEFSIQETIIISNKQEVLNKIEEWL